MSNEIMIGDILKRAGDLIQTSCQEVFTVKSLWLFRHVPERRIWRTWTYLPFAEEVKSAFVQFEKIVYSQDIPEYVGSIGKAYGEFQNSKNWLFIHNTFSAKEGTVIETDLKLGHKDVWFIPFTDADETVISFLLVSLSLRDRDRVPKPENQKSVSSALNSGDGLNIGRLMRFAYHSEKNEEAIDSMKLSQKDSPIEYSKEETPDSFLTQYLLDPLKNYYHSSSILPVIKIEGKHLTKPLFGYSDVVFDILKESLSRSICKEDNIEDGFFRRYLSVLNNKKTFSYGGSNVNLEYLLYCDSERTDLEDCIKNVVSELSRDYLAIQNSSYIKDFDPRTKQIVEKKYITEQLSHKCESTNALNPNPFVLVFKGGQGRLENGGNESFETELVACDIRSYIKKSDLGIETIFGRNRKEYSHEKGDKELIVSIITESESNPFEIDTYFKGFIDQRYLYYKIFIERRHALQEANKSAKAAIMSRNMSHNLGSHVMAYLKNDMRSIPAIFDSEVLHHLFPAKYSGEDIAKIRKEVELPFLVGLGGFIGYLQERQDYIATIASAFIPPFSPVNFKDAIYDELNPDLRFERHHDSNNHNRPQNILLSYIAKSENLSRRESKDGRSHDIHIGFKSTSGLFWGKTDDFDYGLSEMRKLNFALPGGIVGRQAVFSIVENIIRNAAKHNIVEGDLELVFECIDGKEFLKQPDRYSECITDPKLREQYVKATDTPALLFISITDNLPCSSTTVKKLKEALKQQYIGEDEHANKGIKEIRISATWLRGEEDESVFAPCPGDEEDWAPVEGKKAPVVSIEKADDHLRYIIALRRTYEFALVKDSKSDTDFERCFSLPQDSYEVLTASDICDSDTCYEYIIAENKSVYDSIRSRVTNRCLDYSSIDWSMINREKGALINEEDIYCLYSEIPKNTDDRVFIMDDRTPGNGIVDNRILRIDSCKLEYVVPEAGPFNVILGNQAKYLYRSHHFGEMYFTAYWKDRKRVLNLSKDRGERDYANACSSVKCIDAITGDNSSDRLVRRELLDTKWFYGHLYALKSKVAIFDERLFQIIHGLDETQLSSGSVSVSSLIDSYFSGKWSPKILSNSQLSSWAIDLGINSAAQRAVFIQLYNKCVVNKDNQVCMELFNFLDPYRFRINEKINGSKYLTAAYKEKGVDVFTIIPAGPCLCFIIGCINLDYENELSDYQFSFIPVACFEKNKETGRISCKRLPLVDFEYRYLSIHQGLIDKIYEAFGLKDSDFGSLEEKNQKEDDKKNALRELYSTFTGKDSSHLDRLSIHSGRGHITKKDTPLELPFIQYSALEHAVLDCKYSLVELLDFAKFKPIV